MGGRETVCLLNGLAMSTKSWLGFLPELTPTYDVLLFDYLGQGASDDAEVRGGAIPAFGDALAGILDAAGHVVYLERPDLFWPRVRRFFGSKD